MPYRLSPLVYPDRFAVRYVNSKGGIRREKDWINVSMVGAGAYVDLEGINHRTQDCGSNWKTRSSCSQRQDFAMRAAHTTASSREGSSRTVKPPSSGGAHG